jgi:SP family facilitated glucose transporter-like MFS transporter 8
MADVAPLNNSPSVEDGREQPLSASGGDLAAVIDRGFSGENHTDPGQQGSLLLFVAVTCCCVSPILFGYTIGVTSPAQVTMEGDPLCGSALPDGVECKDWSGAHYAPKDLDLAVFSTNSFSWYAGLLNIGAVIGAFSGSFFSERLGRKKTLVLTAVPHAIGWFGSAFCSNPILLTLLRMLLGVGVGIGSAVTPCYIGEVATNDLRGALGAANQLSVTFGIFLVNAFGTYVFEVPVADVNFV